MAPAVFAILAVLAAAPPAPDPAEIVRQSVNRDQDNWRKAKDYTYVEREQEHHGGKTTSKTYEVSTLYGREFRRLIARDDQLLSPGEAAKEQKRFDKAVASRADESPEKRAKEEADAEKEREKERAFAREIPEAYNFVLLGEEEVEGHQAWVIGATPRPGFKPKDSQAKALPKLRGKFWIEKQDYEWVKLEAEVISPLKWGLFIASLNPGTVLKFTQTKVNDELWMPKQVSVQVDARLLMKKFNGDFQDTFSGYRKFQTDARVVSASEADPAPAADPPKPKNAQR